MTRKIICMAFAFAIAGFVLSSGFCSRAQAAGRGQPTDWQRFYYYPYVYYPHNFQRLPSSFNHLYYRYPPEKRIPVYNKSWYNYYPSKRPYHMGHHFLLDVF